MARSQHTAIRTAERRQGPRLRALVDRKTRAAPPAVAPEHRASLELPRPAGAVKEASAGLAAVARLLRGPAPATWVFTGDSITHGALFTEGWRSFVEHFAERVRWELRRFNDVVINTGVCGEKTEGLLRCLDDRILRFRPDVVLVMLGMNDSLAGPAGRAAFHKNLCEIAGRLREGGVIPVLQTPNTVFAPHAATRSDLPAYVEIVREVAAWCEVPLIDHWQLWAQKKPQPQMLLDWLQDQSIHPNYLGHRALAQLIFDSFEIFDPASHTCLLGIA